TPDIVASGWPALTDTEALVAAFAVVAASAVTTSAANDASAVRPARRLRRERASLRTGRCEREPVSWARAPPKDLSRLMRVIARSPSEGQAVRVDRPMSRSDSKRCALPFTCQDRVTGKYCQRIAIEFIEAIRWSSIDFRRRVI